MDFYKKCDLAATGAQVRSTQQEAVPAWRADGSKLLGRPSKLVSQRGCSLSGLNYQGSSQSPSIAPTGMPATL